MTGVNDKPKHKPSAKHTLEDVRKSLEDLVRHQLDDAPPAETQIKAGQRQQDENVDAPEEAAPQRSRHRLHGSGGGQLDTGQVLQSLRELLGNELGGRDVNHQSARASVAEPTEVRCAEDTVTGDSGHDSATTQDRPETPAAGGGDAHGELEALMEADSVEDIDLDVPHKHDEASLDLDEIMAPSDEDGTDTDSASVHEIDIEIAERQDKSSLEALARTARSDNKDTNSPVDTDSADPKGDRERARASQRAPATDIAQSRIIDISSLDGVQQAFLFEDPALVAAVHRREAPTVFESQRDEDAVTATAAADVRPAPQAQTVRKREDSDLRLKEGSPGLKAEPQGAAVLSDASPREQVVVDTPASPDTDASDEKEIELSERERTPEDTADDGTTASDDRSHDLEDLASTLASMDVLEIPGGEQLSDELTQEAQAPAPDEIAEDMPRAEPPSDPDETSLAPESPAPERSLHDEAAHTTEAPSSTATGDGAASVDHDRDQPKGVLSAVVEGQSASLKMPGIDFDADAPIAAADLDTQSEKPVRAPIGAEQKKKPAPARTSAEGKPADATARKERRADADFVELGEAATEKPRFARTPGGTLEASILSRGRSVKSPPAPSPHKGETPSARSPDRSRRFEPKDSARASTVARTSTAHGPPSTTPHLSAPSDGPKTSPAEPGSKAAKAGSGKIPVLRDVVTQPSSDVSATELRKKGSSATANAKSSTELALGKGPARVKSKKPSKAERVGARSDAGTRTLAVRVIAKLNMELRRCGERALSPAIIDRLQFLLREALEQRPVKADKRHEKK